MQVWKDKFHEQILDCIYDDRYILCFDCYMTLIRISPLASADRGSPPLNGMHKSVGVYIPR